MTGIARFIPQSGTSEGAAPLQMHCPISFAVALAAANELRLRLEASSVVRHPGEVGRVRENLLREFLASFCPRGFELGTGFVFDANGNISNQQDIVIFRNSYYPIFNVGGLQHFPAESVVAVLEVKSSLGTRELKNALDGIGSVKKLDRTGGGKNYIVASGMQLVLDPQMHEHQIFSAIVAMSGMASSRATQVVAQWCRTHERTQWPNSVVSAFDYSIYYDTPGDLPRSNTMLSRGLCSSAAGHPENTVPILDFLGQLISFLRVAPIVDFRPTNYFPDSLNHENYVPLADANAVIPPEGPVQT
jgi:hypothetical protein